MNMTERILPTDIMLADRLLRHVLSFSLADVHLPAGIGVLDPFNGPHAAEVKRIVTEFHRRYYSDDRPRVLMLGINPGRLGAGSTGLSFTDTKRCVQDLGIPVQGLHTHEPSSDFFYRMVRAAGGAASFYGRVYVHAVCPLGFVKQGPKGGPINLNYYDDKALEHAVTPFVEGWLRTLVDTGMRRDVALCIGTGKNAAYFTKLNERLGLFQRILTLEHPRYVMQYKARQLDHYIDRYLQALHAVGGL
jgi:hypothetical protein